MTLTLENQCTLREADAFKASLLAASDHDGELLLDGSLVERVDTAGLQLLVAFARHLEQRGRRLAWVAASDAMRGGAKRLGLAGVLGLDTEVAP